MARVLDQQPLHSLRGGVRGSPRPGVAVIDEGGRHVARDLGLHRGAELGNDGALFRLAPPWVGAAFGFWVAAAAVLGLVLPILALLAWGRHASARAALLPDVLVLSFQIASEGVLARVFTGKIVAVIGLVYTGCRVWQLRRARAAFAAAPPAGAPQRTVGALLAVGLAFWSANLGVVAAITAARTLAAG